MGMLRAWPSIDASMHPLIGAAISALHLMTHDVTPPLSLYIYLFTARNPAFLSLPLVISHPLLSFSSLGRGMRRGDPTSRPKLAMRP